MNSEAPQEATAPVTPSVPRPRPLRFAALGDSLTAGVGDRVDGGWRGWAVLLAEALTPAEGDGDRARHETAGRVGDGTAVLGGSASDGRGDRAALPARCPGAVPGAGHASGPPATSRPHPPGRAAPAAPVESDPAESAPAFRNFATSGALTRDVRAVQTPAALAFAPDIASVVVGVNDTLRRSFDIASIARALDEVCAALTARGTVLLTACLPDPGIMLGLPAPLARPLARRQRAVNTLVHTLSARYGAVHLHAADPAWVADRSLWSADRLHPGERGHRMIAARFHAMLTARGLTLGPPPPREPERPPPGRTEALLWLATAGAGWMVRRSTDLLPELLWLAGAEVRHLVRGTAARLDLRADLALTHALTALPPAAPLARMGE
ncbi:SGNH/GDSL hydrolase family protein [Streptomyces sp. NPDC006645]|uniref:SGNH/GDSL hydrolase family protein n=1 Tax=unclassified Streptomyces TaxID=2593676 RepID=UPI0033A3E91D